MPRASIPFHGFNESASVRMYDHGILPHWRQAGCTYFVTFHLADSIPRRVLQEIEHERAKWLTARGIDPKHPDWKRSLASLSGAERRNFERYFARLLNESLDACHGSCILQEPAPCRIVAEALDFFHDTRVWTGDYVVMPNHAHALLTPMDGFELEDILHSIKSYTANRINRAAERNGHLWQRESYDHIVRDFEQLEAFQRYIAANPVKAGLAEGKYILSPAMYH